jgi:hypothetical protein
MVKSSNKNAPSTWLIFLCSRTHAKTSESLTFIHMREREREREKEKVCCNCTTQCTVHFIITSFNVGNVLLCVIYQLYFTVFMYCYTNIKLCIAFGIIRGFKEPRLVLEHVTRVYGGTIIFAKCCLSIWHPTERDVYRLCCVHFRRCQFIIQHKSPAITSFLTDYPHE